MRLRLFQFVGLARDERQPRAHLRERLGHLQSEPARAARDESDPTGEVKELFEAQGRVLRRDERMIFDADALRG